MGCMSNKGSAKVCPRCSWQEGTVPESPMQLPPRTILNGKYYLGRVLGQGGFGITYLGWDLTLNRKLAIKEHFPRDLCSRGKDGHTVRPSQRSQQSFDYGLKKFEEEGRALAAFHDHPGIVTMMDFLRANGTAYIVMAYVEGLTFEEYLREKGEKISFDLALKILIPVMDALREVHAEGVLHRDISPANIYINEKRQVKILDFGSARHAMREQARNLTVLFKPGYAPIEQYSTSGGRHGAWTDVYAVGATLYRAITGSPPLDAPDRLSHDGLKPPSRMGVAIPPESEAALLKALAARPEERFQTVAEFQNAITPRPNATRSVGFATSGEASKPPRPVHPSMSLKFYFFLSSHWPALFLMAILSSGLWYVVQRGPNPPPRPTITLWASPTFIKEGDTVTMIWSSTNATRLDVTVPGRTERLALPLEGSYSVEPDISTTYAFTATGPGGTASDNVTITVGKPNVPVVEAKPTAPAPDPKISRKIRAAITEGDFYRDNGEYQKAIAAYRGGLQLDPQNAVLRKRVQSTKKASAAEGQLSNQ